MELVMVTPWGEHIKIAPYNFEGYVQRFYSEYPPGSVSRAAYQHWLFDNNYRRMSDFTADELLTCRLAWVGTTEEFESIENPNGREESEGESESCR
uniref:Uncharacterized protein n=1 Tax=Pseudomonas phage HRDY3 TaxID=3236930 RepID=A0AB39CE71_9VIRU